MALSKLTVLNDKYVLRKVLGSEGPYDVTYLAWNLSKERTAVVVREYNPSFIVQRTPDGSHFEFKDQHARAHFEYGLNCFVREAAATALIDHPNVVKHEDYFRENDTSYCVSTYHPGATLVRVLEGNSGRIEKRAAYAIIMPLLDGLLAGHRQGLIHGRLSPGQIFLTKSGRPLLFRFHVTRYLLARRCDRVLDMNDRGFTAPELLVVDGKKGPWSDVYSCAATLYSIISGKTPPDALARTEKDPFLDILHSEKEITPALKKVLYRAMSMNLEERPQSILEFKQELMNGMQDAGEKKGTSHEFANTFSMQNPSALGDIPVNHTAEDLDTSYGGQVPFTEPAVSLFTANQGAAFNSGGDGYKGLVDEPVVSDKSPERHFVETNPLGPLAGESILFRPPAPEKLVQSKTAPSVEVLKERVELKKGRYSGKIPLIGGLGIVAIVASLWMSGTLFKAQGDGGGASSGSELETVLPAAANQSLAVQPIDTDTESLDATIGADSMYASGLPGQDVELTVAAGATIDSFALGQDFIQQADSLFGSNRFEQARNNYVMASVYLSSDAYVDSMIVVAGNELDTQITRQQVRRYVRLAQNFINEENYAEAEVAYERALRIAPGDRNVRQQMDALGELMASADADEKRYLYLIGQGDGLFSEGSFQAAMNSYKTALALQAEDEYLIGQIARIEDSLKAIESTREMQESLYTIHRNKADSFFATADYDNAAIHYKAALTQNPADAYALDQLVATEQMKKSILDRITDENGVFIVTDAPPKIMDEAALISQVRYPALAENRSVEGRVVLKMIVNEDGSTSDIQVLQGIGYGCDREAVRILQDARFEPAQHQGEVVRSWHTYAVRFALVR